MTKYAEGRYEGAENILHIWFPQPVDLDTEARVRAFFKDVIDDLIAPCPKKPYLLVNYTNVRIAATMADAYALNIRAFQPLLLGTFRYSVAEDMAGRFTRLAVTRGNQRLSAATNLFPTEAAAREAIRLAKRHDPPPR